MAGYFMRIRIVMLAIAVLSSSLLARFYYWQIIRGEELARAGLAGRVEELASGSGRGMIYDRAGQAFTQAAAPQSSSVAGTGRMPAIAVAAGTADNGESTRRELVRYPESLAAHVIGYINASDDRGVSGIEAQFDAVLSSNGNERILEFIDAQHQPIAGLGTVINRPAPIGAVWLTLDRQLQQIAERVLDRHVQRGAVVIMRVDSGEIAAMVSRPNFSAARVAAVLQDPASPLLNRALLAYQPGSVFKLVTAIAALESKLTSTDEMFFDPGYIDIDGQRFWGWQHHEQQERITLTEAMAYSSNPVFIVLGQRLGAEALLSYARKLGFGSKTGFNWPEEAAGHLPDINHVYNAELANLAIGQGELEATPLQLVRLLTAIANDGVQLEPYIVKQLVWPDGSRQVLRAAKPPNRVFSIQTARSMRRMLEAVTRYGTGQTAYVAAGGSAGKTGSAETGRIQSGQAVTHAWFAGYAPQAVPEYAAVVFVEAGGGGGDIAAPIFREIFSELYRQK